MNVRWLLKKSTYFVGLLLCLCSPTILAQTETPVSDMIEQCQSLEDDKPHEAITLALQVIKNISKANNPINYGHALGCLGWSYAVLEQQDKSRQYAFELEKLATGLNESKHSVTLLRRAGSVYHRIGDRISAADNYQAAMLDADKLKLQQEKIPLLVNLGVLNSEIKAHKKAINNYYKAIDLMEQIDDFRYHAPVLYNLAVTLNGQKRFAESLAAYQKVEAMINEHWPKQRVVQVYFGLATSYAGVGQDEQVNNYVNKILALQEEEESMFSHTFKVFHARMKLKSGDKSGASEVADAAAAFFLANENEEILNSTNRPLDNLAALYEALGLPEKALQIHKKATLIEQNFQESFNRKAMAQMQARLENSQQQEELANLRSQNQQNQIELNKTSYQQSMMILVIGFLLTILLLIVLWQNHSKRQLLKLTTTDPLTSLKNRRGIKLWNERHKMPVAPVQRYLWLIDIDHFRKINDDLGHDAGDTALQTLAATLKKVVNQNRCLGRWGGEEFLLITQDINLAEIQSFADEILQAIAVTEINHGIHKFFLTASIGISVIRDGSDNRWNRAISQADKALYVAKDRGRNCMVMATDF